MTKRAGVGSDGLLAVSLGHSDANAILTGTDTDDYEHIEGGGADVVRYFENDRRLSQFTLLVDCNRTCKLYVQCSDNADDWYDFYQDLHSTTALVYEQKILTITPPVPGTSYKTAYKIDAFAKYWAVTISNQTGSTLDIKVGVM